MRYIHYARTSGVSTGTEALRVSIEGQVGQSLEYSFVVSHLVRSWNEVEFQPKILLRRSINADTQTKLIFFLDYHFRNTGDRARETKFIAPKRYP